jgi:hypothetical protein
MYKERLQGRHNLFQTVTILQYLSSRHRRCGVALCLGPGVLTSRLNCQTAMAPCPPSPAAAIPNVRTAGTSITVTSTSGRSRSASATRTIPTHGSGLAASIRECDPGSIGAGHQQPWTRPALTSQPHERSSSRRGRRPTSRPGVASEHGRPGNMRCGMPA